MLHYCIQNSLQNLTSKVSCRKSLGRWFSKTWRFLLACRALWTVQNAAQYSNSSLPMTGIKEWSPCFTTLITLYNLTTKQLIVITTTIVVQTCLTVDFPNIIQINKQTWRQLSMNMLNRHSFLFFPAIIRTNDLRLLGSIHVLCTFSNDKSTIGSFWWR